MQYPRVYQVDNADKIWGKMTVHIQYSSDPNDIEAHRVPVSETSDCTALAHQMLKDGAFDKRTDA